VSPSRLVPGATVRVSSPHLSAVFRS
jgi:hypothetical protein